MGWLAQIVLFLMLGLLVTPHELPPVFVPALEIAGVLIVLARPAGVLASLLPFRWPLREAMFVSWVGLRGAVPIFLTIIPLLAGVARGPAAVQRGVRRGDRLGRRAGLDDRARGPAAAAARRPAALSARAHAGQRYSTSGSRSSFSAPSVSRTATNPCAA